MTGSWSDKVMETSFCAASISACKNGSSNQFVHVKVSALMLKSIKMFYLRVNSLKRYSKGGNGKNEEFDQIWWKVLWHDGKTPRHSGPAWGGPWGILWGKFFFPNFWNFWNFFFQNALSQAWLIWPMWNLDMFWRQHEILIWRKKILKFRKFVKTTFFYSFLPNGSFWGRIHSPNQI